MTMHFGRADKLGEIVGAVDRYGDAEFESPTRSTIPMLSLLMQDIPKFHEILTCIGFPTNYDDLFLEYTVSPPQGRGRASHTDVMLKAGPRSLAIEAKWTEPMYDTVANWLCAGRVPENRESVLEGWLSLLNKHATAPVQTSACHGLIYQMIHRAASAVAAGQEPCLAYFVFKPSGDQPSATSDQIYEKLSGLWGILGYPSCFPCHVVEIGITDTPAFAPLRGLPRGKVATAEAMRAALKDLTKPLFGYKDFKCRAVARNP